MRWHDLAGPPADVTGAALRRALNAPSSPPLVACRLIHPDGGVLKLGVLGASHVVAVEHTDVPRFCEQVSCTAQVDGAQLPKTAKAPGYQLDSRISSYEEVAFRQLAQHL